MKILAIDSSAKSASVAICDGGRLVAETFLNCGLTHSVTIMPSVEWLLKTAGIKLSEIEKIAVSVGPGSFTGLRIGLAAVKGLAYGFDIPCCGVSTLHAAAYGASFFEGTVCAVMDARANQVYNALFRSEGGKLTRLCEDRAISLESLFSELSEKENVIFVGDGAEICYERCGKKYAIAPEPMRYQRAAYVAMLAEGLPAVEAKTLTPEYIRLPQAERERLKMQKGETI